MNCRTAERLLSRALDNELPPRGRERLQAHLNGCALCRQAREQWSEYGAAFRDLPVPPGQTPEAAWADVRRAIRPGEQTAAASPETAFGSRMRWAAVMVAVLGLCVGMALAVRFISVPPAATMAEADATEVEWVGTDLPDASSMVYRDAETGLTVIWVVVAEPGETDETI